MYAHVPVHVCTTSMNSSHHMTPTMEQHSYTCSSTLANRKKRKETYFTVHITHTHVCKSGHLDTKPWVYVFLGIITPHTKFSSSGNTCTCIRQYCICVSLCLTILVNRGVDSMLYDIHTCTSVWVRSLDITDCEWRLLKQKPDNKWYTFRDTFSQQQSNWCWQTVHSCNELWNFLQWRLLSLKTFQWYRTSLSCLQ